MLHLVDKGTGTIESVFVAGSGGIRSDTWVFQREM